MQRQCGNKKNLRQHSERGKGVSSLCTNSLATSKPSGMTGTGAPVTEQLRCWLANELGWYRETLRPYVWARFIFLYLYNLMEVEFL